MYKFKIYIKRHLLNVITITKKKEKTLGNEIKQ